MCFFIQCQRLVADVNLRPFSQFNQRFGTLFEAIHPAQDPSKRDLRYPLAQKGFEQIHKPRVVCLADIVGVKRIEFVKIKPRGRLDNPAQIKPFCRLCIGDNLVIPMPPAKTQQIITHRLGQIAHRRILAHPDSSMTLGKLLSIPPVNQRQMRILRHVPAHGTVNLHLPERIGEMVVSTNHMRHAHVVVIHNHRQHIGRRPVRADKDHIVKLAVLHAHLAKHGINNDRLAIKRSLEANHRLHTFGCLARITIPPAAIVARGKSGLFLCGAHRLQLFGRRIAIISLACRQHLLGDLDMTPSPLKLHGRFAIPLQPKPVKPVKNGLRRLGSRAFAVGVFNAQEKFAAVMLGKQIVVQSGPCSSDMHISGRRRGDAANDTHNTFSCLLIPFRDKSLIEEGKAKGESCVEAMPERTERHRNRKGSKAVFCRIVPSHRTTLDIARATWQLIGLEHPFIQTGGGFIRV